MIGSYCTTSLLAQQEPLLKVLPCELLRLRL